MVVQYYFFFLHFNLQDQENDIQIGGNFDTTDDFTVIVQPFFEDYNQAPLTVN